MEKLPIITDSELYYCIKCEAYHVKNQCFGFTKFDITGMVIQKREEKDEKNNYNSIVD